MLKFMKGRMGGLAKDEKAKAEKKKRREEGEAAEREAIEKKYEVGLRFERAFLPQEDEDIAKMERRLGEQGRRRAAERVKLRSNEVDEEESDSSECEETSEERAEREAKLQAIHARNLRKMKEKNDHEMKEEEFYDKLLVNVEERSKGERKVLLEQNEIQRSTRRETTDMLALKKFRRERKAEAEAAALSKAKNDAAAKEKADRKRDLARYKAKKKQREAKATAEQVVAAADVSCEDAAGGDAADSDPEFTSGGDGSVGEEAERIGFWRRVGGTIAKIWHRPGEPTTGDNSLKTDAVLGTEESEVRTEEQSMPSFASADLNPAVDVSASADPAGARLDSVEETGAQEDAGESPSEDGEVVPQEGTEGEFFDQLLEDTEKRKHRTIKLDRARAEEKKGMAGRKAARRAAAPVAKRTKARSPPRYDDQMTPGLFATLEEQRDAEKRRVLQEVEDYKQILLEIEEEREMQAELDAQQDEIREGLMMAKQRRRKAEERKAEERKAEEKKRSDALRLGFDPALGTGNLNKRVEIVGLEGPLCVLNGKRGTVVSIKGKNCCCVIELDTGRRFSTKLDALKEAPLRSE